MIRASYDAAQTTTDNTNHWAAADSYDADSANSLSVRKTLTKRSRYECNNNGHGKGIVLTQANYVIGRGPRLDIRTRSEGYNSMVEAAWIRWTNRVHFARKLRTACKAKVGDGEGFIIARNNPALRDPVKLDLVGTECEQVTTHQLPWGEVNHIDGIKFDEFGNPLSYDVLRYHPGGEWSYLASQSEEVPAKFVLHWFREDRPGQHRAVPELSPTLGLFAPNRRFREATVAAAETAADFAAVMRTNASPSEEPDAVRPFTSVPIEKRTLTALPFQWEMQQLRAEHPNATYDTFVRSQICEESRPLNMPYNIAACDSSGYSFSGGRLDHLTYFVSVDVEQADCEDMVLDPLFELWWAEAILTYGWVGDAEFPPTHEWVWPARPQIDDLKTANAREVGLGTGSVAPSDILTEDGRDWEVHVAKLAEDYGVSAEEIKRALFEVNVLSRSKHPQEPSADSQDEPPPQPRNGNAINRVRANGHNRLLHTNGSARP
jgi:capsid protein